jgi:capsular polysaccharide transport system permease protein
VSHSENTSHRVQYLGPVTRETTESPPFWKQLRQRVPLAFVLVVVLPTLVAAIYFLLIASPRYVSEARFVVRQASKEQPSSLGLALQGVGISTSQTDSFAVHEYIDSRDALRELMQSVPVREIYGPANVDTLSRVPGFGAGSSFEDLYKGLNRYVEVGYDSTTGISVLRVQAFNPRDAQRVSLALLAGGERLVNRLNVRAQSKAIEEAEYTVEEAQRRAAAARAELANFRNREGLIDPAQTAVASTELVGQLETTVAGLRAERSQIAAGAPSSPQLPAIDTRIAAYERQIEAEKARMTGGIGSLASKAGAYEQLTVEREFADRALMAANQSMVTARQESQRQQLYLERIVNPDLSDKPSEPRRWLAILTVLAISLTAYGTGWLIMAGVRESHQS